MCLAISSLYLLLISVQGIMMSGLIAFENERYGLKTYASIELIIKVFNLCCSEQLLKCSGERKGHNFNNFLTFLSPV